MAVINSMVTNHYGRICSSRAKALSRVVLGGPTSRRPKWVWSGWPRFSFRVASHNIRVNVVCPGSIDTSRANPEWYQGRVPSAGGIPLRRQGMPEEIAATALFLVTDDSGFITGQTIHANGGVAFF